MDDGRLDAAALFRAHAPFVASFLARMGAPGDEMDDLLQEVFLVAHRRGGYVPGAARPSTWLAEIAIRVGANARRARQRRDRPEQDHIEGLPGSDGPEQALAQQQRRALIQRCLGRLDDEHRAVLILHELNDEPCAEIAAALGVPVGTVHSRLHTARKQFQKAWSRERGEGSP